ncbi:N-acyl amino acid synthase FeeM domain-containing protein [Desulfovibrio sp. Fe33]|uniref:N-acyl amino acid synthase FeeM domain-containing protein n=1 Tax=Desulfovibrio sp. Fe33 TaxID=3020842 RepID=UPI00234D7174|nr:hypothetical protein [Desulfovibrio sp. Fe33]
MPEKEKGENNLLNGVERRRTLRIRRSSLIDSKLEGLEKPSIKIAETKEELEQAFKTVYSVYRGTNYIAEDHPSEMSYSVFSLLPTTCAFIFKEYLTVISTMSFYIDSEAFGLPMDSLYKQEIDALRAQGRKVAEIGALATPRRRRWSNLVVYLSKALFNYAHLTGVDDMCIMVNPKHVRFYKDIFLFQDFGEERWYKGVNAPAVALRISFRDYNDAMFEAYGQSDFDTNLYGFFTRVNNSILAPHILQPVERNKPLSPENLRYFLSLRPEILDGLTAEQLDQFKLLYHEAFYA